MSCAFPQCCPSRINLINNAGGHAVKLRGSIPSFSRPLCHSVFWSTSNSRHGLLYEGDSLNFFSVSQET
jgi:hypothetical protein